MTLITRARLVQVDTAPARPGESVDDAIAALRGQVVDLRAAVDRAQAAAEEAGAVQSLAGNPIPRSAPTTPLPDVDTELYGWDQTLFGGAGGPVRVPYVVRSELSALSFGADPTGTVNSTAALNEFLAACVGGKRRGKLPAGRYKITPGQLLAQPEQDANTQGPRIETDGHWATTLFVDPATSAPGGVPIDAPLLRLWGPDVANGHVLREGLLGGLAFEDTTGHVAPNRCGLSVRGLVGWHFGFLYGLTLRGDVLRVPSAHGPFGADAFNVTDCTFTAAHARSCLGLALNNLNDAGFNLNTVRSLRAEMAGGVGGGVLGTGGAGNVYESISLVSCHGWAIDLYDVGSTVGRERIGRLELDAPEYGIRIADRDSVSILDCRINHRFMDGDAYWPRVAFRLGEGGAVVYDLATQIIHRISAPASGQRNAANQLASAADLGILYDGQASTSLRRVRLGYSLVDGSGFPGGFPASHIQTGFHPSSSVLISSATDGIVLDTSPRRSAVASCSSSAAVPASGFGTTRFPFDDVLYDPLGLYDATALATRPATGPDLIEVEAMLLLEGAPVGAKARCGFVRVRGGAPAIMAHKADRADSTDDWPLEVRGAFDLAAGDVVYFSADIAGGPAAVSAGSGGGVRATCRVSYHLRQGAVL